MALGLAGCPQQCPRTRVSLDRLVGEYNSNAAAVPRLWARAKIAVTLADKKGRTFTLGSTSPLAAPNGLLLLFKGANKLGPHDFVLVGREIAGVELFRLGSSTEQGIYYFWYHVGDASCAWWGRHENAGAPGQTDIPIDPNQLLGVLGICQMPDDFTALPTVTLSMSRKPCAYVLTYIDRQAGTGRIGARREVYFQWDNKKLRRPFLIKFFAPDGRRVMTARLRDYKPIKVEDGGRETEIAPAMATDIEIEVIKWPGEETDNSVRRVHLVLTGMTTEEKGRREACTFRPPPGEVIQLDEGLERRGAEE
jgi:hypothetical protein